MIDLLSVCCQRNTPKVYNNGKRKAFLVYIRSDIPKTINFYTSYTMTVIQIHMSRFQDGSTILFIWFDSLKAHYRVWAYKNNNIWDIQMWAVASIRPRRCSCGNTRQTADKNWCSSNLHGSKILLSELRKVFSKHRWISHSSYFSKFNENIVVDELKFGCFRNWDRKFKRKKFKKPKISLWKEWTMIWDLLTKKELLWVSIYKKNNSIMEYNLYMHDFALTFVHQLSLHFENSHDSNKIALIAKYQNFIRFSFVSNFIWNSSSLRAH